MTDGNDLVNGMFRNLPDGSLIDNKSLTKRELFAAMAMSNWDANELSFGTYGSPDNPWPWVAEQSVKAADALIAELNKEQGV